MLTADSQLHAHTWHRSTLLWGHPWGQWQQGEGLLQNPRSPSIRGAPAPLQGAGGGGWLRALLAAHIRQRQMEEVTDKGLSLEKKQER